MTNETRTDHSFLVTGGAGYIGSEVAAKLLTLGRVTVLDDLSTGLRSSVSKGAEFIRGSVLDLDLLRRVLTENSIDAVIHLAGAKAPGESVINPDKYFQINVLGTRNVLLAMTELGVENFVFSSSCSVYGSPQEEVVHETTLTKPTSPYGESKLYGEQLTSAFASSYRLNTGRTFRWAALRYFNVIGASSALNGDRGLDNLVPQAIRAIQNRNPVSIYGSDWPTPDGTCVRDYIDVVDLADCHVKAIQKIFDCALNESVINISTGVGVSVRQVLDAIDSATNSNSLRVERKRRPGDPARIVGSPDTAVRLLGWEPKADLTESIARAVRAAVIGKT